MNPCTRCQGPVEPPRSCNSPRRRPDLCLSCGRWAIKVRYRQSEKNRAAQARYYRSEKGRVQGRRNQQSESYRAWKSQYNRSKHGRAVWACWAQTEKGRVSVAASKARRQASGRARASTDRYQQTEAGRASRLRNSALRRAKKRDAIIFEPVDRRVILALDGGLCHLCDLPVIPEAFHLDHVIPLSVEPIHANFNAAIAHLTCNQRKWAQLIALSPMARARWQERRPKHLALLEEHLTRLAS